ncbi:hypothetical protein [Kribbella ginsengisoli]|uniref:SRPBCC domain-containing protein n=1 Tax=Kribbella ginsengisoli TaxID=363865 RepID=A0ABP6YTH6_9ACTN
MSDYSTSFTVQQSADEVYAAILNVGAWWTGEIEGRADEVGGEFAYRHLPQHYSLQRVVELEPGRRVAWEVVDSKLAFVSEPSEWTGSQIVFDILPGTQASGGTDVGGGEHEDTPDGGAVRGRSIGSGAVRGRSVGGRAVQAGGVGAEVRFTHLGLVPEVECFGACSTAWRHYVNGSLYSLITTGEGLADPW